MPASAANAQGMGAQELRVQPAGRNTLSCYATFWSAFATSFPDVGGGRGRPSF